MNKKVLWAVGALAVGASVIVGGTLLAQPGGAAPAAPPAAPAPTVKIAFINLAYVLKHYHKVDALAKDFQSGYKQYEDRAKLKKDEIDRLTAESNKPDTAAAKRDANAKMCIQLKREIEDINTEARSALAPRSEANTVGVYRDIQETAMRVAGSHGFEMVLQFQDGFTPEDYQSPMNIMNKMQTRACIPMWYQPTMDISLDVVNTLNASYDKTAAPAPGGAAPAPAPGPAPK